MGGRVFWPACALVLASAFAACSGSGGDSHFPGGDDTSADAGGEAAVCPGNQTSCGGTCVDTATDNANCGQCGQACTGGTCCEAKCIQEATDCTFTLLGVTPQQGNQNGGDWITITGAGFVKGMQVRIGDGVAPARVVDSKTAVLITPPGPIGSQDVEVISGLNRAKLPQQFLYVAGSLVLPWAEKPMTTVRGENPGLAVMQGDHVLIAGGALVPDTGPLLDTAEVYDRATDTSKAVANKMGIVRWHLSATTMLTGKVLVAGGNDKSAAVDVFDPTTNTFAPTAQPMSVARGYGTAGVLMADGRVMLTSTGTQTVDIYDPDADTFTKLDTLAIHSFPVFVRLRDGRILLGGGETVDSQGKAVGVSSVEIWDPGSGKFTAAAPMNSTRTMTTAHVLPDSRVMVVGGCTQSSGAVTVPLDTIELYDPKANSWTTATYKMQNPRCWHASALVRDGTVIAMGGYDTNLSCHPTNTVDQIDPVAGTVKPFGQLPHTNTEWNAVTLLDGSVLGVGGGACGGFTGALPDLDFLPGKPGQQ